MNSRDQFEQAYAEDNAMKIADVVDQRMSKGGYRDYKISRAWHWWQRAREEGEAMGGISGALDSVVSTENGRSVLLPSEASPGHGLG